MNLIARRLKNERRQRLSGAWRANRSADKAENELFDASFELAEAARDLDQAAGSPGTAAVTAAMLGCTTSALYSQADGVHRMASLIRHELAPPERGSSPSADLEELHQVLAKIEDNLRFSAGEADRARRLAAAILDRAPTGEQLLEPDPVPTTRS